MVKAYGKLPANDLIKVRLGYEDESDIIFIVRLDKFKFYTHVTGEDAAIQLTEIQMNRVYKGLRTRINRLTNVNDYPLKYTIFVVGMTSYLHTLRKHVAVKDREKMSNEIANLIAKRFKELGAELGTDIDYLIDLHHKAQIVGQKTLGLSGWIESFNDALKDIRKSLVVQSQYPRVLIQGLMTSKTEYDIISDWDAHYQNLKYAHKSMSDHLEELIDAVIEYRLSAKSTNGPEKKKLVKELDQIIADEVGTDADYADAQYGIITDQSTHIHRELWKFYAGHVLRTAENLVF